MKLLHMILFTGFFFSFHTTAIANDKTNEKKPTQTKKNKTKKQNHESNPKSGLRHLELNFGYVVNLPDSEYEEVIDAYEITADTKGFAISPRVIKFFTRPNSPFQHGIGFGFQYGSLTHSQAYGNSELVITGKRSLVDIAYRLVFPKLANFIRFYGDIGLSYQLSESVTIKSGTTNETFSYDKQFFIWPLVNLGTKFEIHDSFSLNLQITTSSIYAIYGGVGYEF